jgi:hypothetical protein
LAARAIVVVLLASSLACEGSSGRALAAPLDLSFDRARFDAGVHADGEAAAGGQGGSAPASADGGSAGSLNAAPGACDGAPCLLPSVSTRTYESDCAEDMRVQWGFLTYAVTTPADSSVQFRIRTAETSPELNGASWIELATAQAVPDTQQCILAGPMPCFIDLYVMLGGSPRAHYTFAEVEVTQNPTSDRTQPSTVQSWQINFSCAFQ